MKYAATLVLLALGAGSPIRARERVRPAERGVVEEQVTVPLLGKVAVVRPVPVQRTRGVVLFVSGDGGWKLGVIAMARRIASQALVVGIPMPVWQKEVERGSGSCWYPAGELESIAQAAEKIYKFPRYLRPILVGYSSGATLVYGALAQAPAETFAGAVSLGFCPDLDVARAVCDRGTWNPVYDQKKRRSLLPPRPDLPARMDGAAVWTALQGQADQVCDPREVERFVGQVPAARVVSLPKVGHGFSVPRNWGDSFDEAVDALLDPVTAWEPGHTSERSGAPNRAPAEINRRLEALDLPLVISWPAAASDVLIFVSGDGGWMELDQELASRLHDAGVAVIGWSALRYFWEPKSPEDFGADLARVVQALPQEMRIFAGGYSFGAEVVPVTLGREVSDASTPLSRIQGMVLLAPGPYASFEVSPLDWIFRSTTPTDYPVRGALGTKPGIPALCVEPSASRDSGCPEEPLPGVRRLRLPGSHHFGGDYRALSERILEFLGGAGE